MQTAVTFLTISVVKDRLVFMTEILRLDDFGQKVSVVSDYLPNVTSDHQILHAQSHLHVYVPEYGTTVEYTCTSL